MADIRNFAAEEYVSRMGKTLESGTCDILTTGPPPKRTLTAPDLRSDSEILSDLMRRILRNGGNGFSITSWRPHAAQQLDIGPARLTISDLEADVLRRFAGEWHRT